MICHGEEFTKGGRSEAMTTRFYFYFRMRHHYLNRLYLEGFWSEMDIRLLGAHNTESPSLKFASLLVDDNNENRKSQVYR